MNSQSTPGNCRNQEFGHPQPEIFIQKLKEMGWLEKHEEMKQKGFDRPFQNYRFLMKTNGQVQQAIKQIQKKQLLKRENLDWDNIQKVIEEKGLKEKVQKMNQAGFPNKKRCVIFLLESEGDVELAMQALKQDRERFGCDPSIFNKLIQDRGFTEQVKQMQELGFTNQKRCYQLLVAHDGDLEKAIKDMTEFPGKCGFRGGNEEEEQNFHPHFRHHHQENKQEIEKLIKEKGYQEQVKIMNQNGFPNRMNCLKFLQKNDGNVEIAMKELQEFRSQFKIAQYEETLERLVEEYGFADKLKVLSDMGFPKKQRNLQFLATHDGNVEEAAIAMKAIESTGFLFLNGKQNPELNIDAEVEKYIEANQWAEKIKFLNEQGFYNRRQCLIHLISFDGDVDQALKSFSLIDNQFARRGQWHKFHKHDHHRHHGGHGFHEAQPGHSEDDHHPHPHHGHNHHHGHQHPHGHHPHHGYHGRHSKSPFKHQMKEENKKKFEKELKILESAGFEKPHKNLKLLIKFDGNVEKVSEKLKYQREQKEKSQEDTEALTLQYCEGLQFLCQKGFLQIKKNIKALLQNDGNQEEALQLLLRKKEKKLKGIENSSSSDCKRQKHQQNNFKHSEENYHCHSKQIFPHQKQDDFCLLEWKPVLNRVFVDGNNLMFMDENLRKLYLKQMIKEVQIRLFELIQLFAMKKKQEVVLVFDNTEFFETFTIEGNITVNVTSARPYFVSSDDALVDWVSKDTGKKDLLLVVTSDKELQQRLLKTGPVNIMRGGSFLKEVENTIGQENYEKIVTK